MPRATSDQPDLGAALESRTDDVVVAVRERSAKAGRALHRTIDDRFVGATTTLTLAGAAWVAGRTSRPGLGTSEDIWADFGAIASEGHLSLGEVMTWIHAWRDSAVDVLQQESDRLRRSHGDLEDAVLMMQRFIDYAIVEICGSFERERQRMEGDLAERRAELVYEATHDSLTGLPNRGLVLERINQMLARSRRSDKPVGVFVIDVDNFATINDTLGSDTGDELLKAISTRLEETLRETDVFGRIGGDEFALVAEGLGSESEAELIAERVIGAIRRPFLLEILNEGTIPLTASVGIAMGNRRSAEELLRDADLAMLRAKWTGKNRYVFFELRQQVALQSRLRYQKELPLALEGRESLPPLPADI